MSSTRLFTGVQNFNMSRRGKNSSCTLLTIKTKARDVVGRGEKNLLSDPGLRNLPKHFLYPGVYT